MVDLWRPAVLVAEVVEVDQKLPTKLPVSRRNGNFRAASEEAGINTEVEVAEVLAKSKLALAIQPLIPLSRKARLAARLQKTPLQ